MDKDDFSYKFSKHDAIEKIANVLGQCTIQDGTGVFARKDGQKYKAKH